MRSSPAPRPRVVIVGGGFGGLAAARQLRRAPVEVTLLDRRNFHLFQPLLYQVATGGLSPANIAAPLRAVLRHYPHMHVQMAEVVGFDLDGRSVLLADGAVPYDYLVVATGATHNYFGHPDWEELAPGLKTLEDATEIRRRILSAFEIAEREAEAGRATEGRLTFVVIGAGPTGLELAGTLAEIARDTLRRDFRRIDPASARIVLLDAAERVLPSYPPELSEKAARSLASLGVQVRTGVRVTSIEPGVVQLQSASGNERIAACTVVWAAGVQGSRLGRPLAQASGAQLDRAGRVHVEPDCSLPGRPEVFVVGDLALLAGPDGQPLPAIAPVAIQQGRYVARRIAARVRGRRPGRPFRYRSYGMMATIGRAMAVADFGWARFSGLIAWVLWLFVHLMYLVEFQNRVLVLIQWAGNYFTFNRSARLITGEPPPAPRADKPGRP